MGELLRMMKMHTIVFITAGIMLAIKLWSYVVIAAVIVVKKIHAIVIITVGRMDIEKEEDMVVITAGMEDMEVITAGIMEDTEEDKEEDKEVDMEEDMEVIMARVMEDNDEKALILHSKLCKISKHK